jgi:UDP-N-acetylglucosamine--N-acetylmuramyl-(pentapeptide) pyrophosphoryl-undecaprenol N-acetylglucosamine transferase
MNRGPINVLFAGGGTGGHVIPAIAVAEDIVRAGGRARFVGLKGKLEATLAPKAGFGIDFINVRPLSGRGLAGVVLGLGSVPSAVARSAHLIEKTKPDVVLGVGGYVAGPVVLAAKLKKVPTALLEQNATVGLTNTLLAPIVDRAFVSYEETIGVFRRGRAEITGNPVRQSILDASKISREKAAGRVNILVMGGSQGARAIDERVPAAVSLAGIADKVTVLHQCGTDREAQVLTVYRDARIEAKVVTFIEDTASAYLEADLVVARSGATTLSEICVMGLPAVLLPYPHHADRQQELNAEPMRKAGAALVLDEKNTGVKEMAQAIAQMVQDEGRRSRASKASRSLGRPDAAQSVVHGLQRLVGKP